MAVHCKVEAGKQRIESQLTVIDSFFRLLQIGEYDSLFIFSGDRRKVVAVIAFAVCVIRQREKPVRVGLRCIDRNACQLFLLYVILPHVIACIIGVILIFGCAVFVNHYNSGDAEICHEFFEFFDGAIVEIRNVTTYFLRLVDYPEKALCKVGRSYFFIADTLTSDIFYCAVGHVFCIRCINI